MKEVETCNLQVVGLPSPFFFLFRPFIFIFRSYWCPILSIIYYNNSLYYILHILLIYLYIYYIHYILHILSYIHLYYIVVMPLFVTLMSTAGAHWWGWARYQCHNIHQFSSIEAYVVLAFSFIGTLHGWRCFVNSSRSRFSILINVSCPFF